MHQRAANLWLAWTPRNCAPATKGKRYLVHAEMVFLGMLWGPPLPASYCTARTVSVPTSGGTRAGMATNSKWGSPISFQTSQRKSSPKFVVTFSRNVTVLKILLSMEDDGFCLNFLVLNTHSVATQCDGDVFTDLYQISMPVRHILGSNARCYIRHWVCI